jgi:hypothetical protein
MKLSIRAVGRAVRFESGRGWRRFNILMIMKRSRSRNRHTQIAQRKAADGLSCDGGSMGASIISTVAALELFSSL